MKKYIIYSVLIVIVIASVIAGNNYYKKYKIEKLIGDPYKTYELEKTATAKILSDYLEVLDVQVVPQHSVNANLVIKLKNNYNKSIKGLFDIYLLDSSGKIVRTWVGELPNAGILPGRTATINTLINKQNFTSIKIEGNSLREGD